LFTGKKLFRRNMFLSPEISYSKNGPKKFSVAEFSGSERFGKFFFAKKLSAKELSEKSSSVKNL
jgi:hypothetical protein